MKFRKKPVIIEARQLTIDSIIDISEWVEDCLVDASSLPQYLIIRTLEGNYRANFNDWVIKEIKGEFYPCKPDIFDATYKAVTEG